MKKRFAKRILAFMLVIMVFMTDIPTFARDSKDLEETGIESTEEIQVVENLEDSTQEEPYIVSEVKEGSVK